MPPTKESWAVKTAMDAFMPSLSNPQNIGKLTELSTQVADLAKALFTPVDGRDVIAIVIAAVAVTAVLLPPLTSAPVIGILNGVMIAMIALVA
jgi:hypothetical protein